MNKQSFMLAIALAAVSVSSQAQEPSIFVDVLNKCLSTPGASIDECARIAGSVSGSDSVWVRQEFNFAPGAGQPGGTGAKVLGDCYGNLCEILECEEDVQTSQSICSLVGICTTDKGGGWSECHAPTTPGQPIP